jgi:hypothetical protein
MAEALYGLELILRGVAERHRAAYVAGARRAVAIRGYRAAASRNAALLQQRAPFLRERYRVRGITAGPQEARQYRQLHRRAVAHGRALTWLAFSLSPPRARPTSQIRTRSADIGG